ncbi:Uncharacterised protein [Vibrio cholerae]|nr:Uncharacterised protein [Vibrio cholerae]
MVDFCNTVLNKLILTFCAEYYAFDSIEWDVK